MSTKLSGVLVGLDRDAKAAAKGNRHKERDATMLLVAYRHGLRVSELCDPRWEQIDFQTAKLAVRRAKKGTPLSSIRNVRSFSPPNRGAVHDRRVCVDGGTCRKNRDAPFQSASGYAATRMWLALANAGHDTRSLQAYLGHKNIQHTCRYTELSPAQFKNFWHK